MRPLKAELSEVVFFKHKSRSGRRYNGIRKRHSKVSDCTLTCEKSSWKRYDRFGRQSRERYDRYVIVYEIGVCNARILVYLPGCIVISGP